MPLSNGTMVSHYRIIEKIGAGGMGEIVLYEDVNPKEKGIVYNSCLKSKTHHSIKREKEKYVMRNQITNLIYAFIIILTFIATGSVRGQEKREITPEWIFSDEADNR